MDQKAKKVLLWILDLSINVGVILILVFVIQKWLIAPFDVSGASMCDTLNYINDECESGYGEKIIINEAGYIFSEPERGEIVVFKADMEEDKYYIKRVIGLPGETVEIKNGKIYITKPGEEEAKKLNEEYLNGDNFDNTKVFFSNFSVFSVPEDHYFLLGDNRKASTDSRSCFLSSIKLDCKDTPERAYIHKDNIRGKAWIAWWPLSKLRIIHGPDYLLDQEISESLAEK
ncbi:signal peptidase I [Candidatus Peregrinibacteria bacterium]|jgi:signal peptidase I|nr:signal peptidase I [Candidatus Peregrinibacteria bacterium]MBT7736538.1 signal peptidase I [Candidatus Peregrinibacteria bacterium]